MRLNRQKLKLRLRGPDAPEIQTAAGQEAKRFLESVIASPARRGDTSSSAAHVCECGRAAKPRAISTPIVITASRSDKYDRYLADVWSGETYVNQELLSAGLAVRITE